MEDPSTKDKGKGLAESPKTMSEEEELTSLIRNLQMENRKLGSSMEEGKLVIKDIHDDLCTLLHGLDTGMHRLEKAVGKEKGFNHYVRKRQRKHMFWRCGFKTRLQ